MTAGKMKGIHLRVSASRSGMYEFFRPYYMICVRAIRAIKPEEDEAYN
jgi:hypothetical protein